MGSLALIALIVFAPLGIFFVTHPETFAVRMNQISILAEGGGGTWQSVALRNTLRALQVFTWRGDPDVRLNLPDLPMFQGLAPAFYLGLVVVILRLARRGGFLGRVRYALLVIWPLVMLIPTILADPTASSTQPASHRRDAARLFHSRVGICRGLERTAAIYTQPTLDDGAGLRYIPGHSDGERRVYVPELFYALGAPAQTVLFQRQRPRGHDRYLNSLPDDGRTLYVGAPDYRHPTVAALARNYSQMKWVQGGEAFVFSPDPAIYAWSHAALPDDWWLARTFHRNRVSRKNLRRMERWPTSFTHSINRQ